MPDPFLKRLRHELPYWREQGWVTADSEEAIINHISTNETREGFLVHSLALLGVLLLGSGVITFFAANWSELAKLSKLTILFSTMWLSYALAGYLLNRAHYPKTEVIIMTAYGSEEKREEALRNGARYYLEKPFEIRELKDLVMEILKQ